MPTVSFYGSSDDLVEVSGVPGEDEFNVIGKGRYMGCFNVGGQMRVHAIYDGCWSFAVGQVDEEIPLPNWEVRVGASENNRYSTCLEIVVPKGVGVFLEEKRGGW